MLHSTRKLLLLVILCVSFVGLRVNLQGQLSSAYFAVRPTDKAFLHYDYIVNSFDSAGVAVMFGEFKVTNGSTAVRINLQRIADNTTICGVSSAGRDMTLAAKCRTDNFILPSGTLTVTFFRELMGFSSPCNGTVPEPSPEGVDRNWMLGIAKVPERTEFIIELVNASNNSVICTLDSVGALPNPLSSIVSRYGTYPDAMNHSRSLPVGHGGDTAYFRCVPVRDSMTVYGMRASQSFNHVNLSALREYGYYNLNKLSYSQADSLETLYWNDLKTYADSMYSANGKIPRLPFLMPNGHEADVINRYLDTTYHNLDTTIYSPKTAPQGKKSLYEIESDSSSFFQKVLESGNTMNLTARYSQPGQLIVLNSKYKEPVYNVLLMIYSSTGHQVFKDLFARVPGGSGTFNLRRKSGMIDGLYLIVMADTNGEILGSCTVVVY